MNVRQPLQFITLCLMGAALVNCGAATTDSGGPSGEGTDEAPAADGNVGTRADAVMVLPPRCYGKMLRVEPIEHDIQPIGLPTSVRINRACDRGAPLVARKIRVYIRRFEVGGTPGPQLMLKDWTDTASTDYRLNIPWEAGKLADGSVLAAGRYQIYSYSLNASLYQSWLANDPYAKQMSTRSDNTYVVLKDAGTWSTTSWGQCSATCGGGVQTRVSTCTDGAAIPIDDRMCLSSAPAAQQACNEAPCSSPADDCAATGGSWDGVTCQYGFVHDPMMDCMMSGGMWNGAYCDHGFVHDPMMDCMMSGGMWNGAYCDHGP